VWRGGGAIPILSLDNSGLENAQNYPAYADEIGWSNYRMNLSIWGLYLAKSLPRTATANREYFEMGVKDLKQTVCQLQD
jgi:hypothetical protein